MLEWGTDVGDRGPCFALEEYATDFGLQKVYTHTEYLIIFILECRPTKEMK